MCILFYIDRLSGSVPQVIPYGFFEVSEAMRSERSCCYFSLSITGLDCIFAFTSSVVPFQKVSGYR